MNKLAKRITVIGLSAALLVGGTGMAYTLAGSNTDDTKKETTAPVIVEEEAEITKDETVYVIAGADGSIQKVIVSDWIKNALGDAKLTDKSMLTGIENVNGNEAFTVNGDNMTVWDAQGNDIYYRGDIQKELPVGMKVSYMLDGRELSADEIAGKSGKVTIRFDYENRQYEMKDINGKKEKIYVPFAMMTGMLLDNDTFHNVEVSNGRLVNDGDRMIVVGVAFPGLKDNLALDDILAGEDKAVEIPDHVEITADVTNFKFGMTVTVASNELFNDIDWDKDDSFGELLSSMDDLTDGMTQLMDGSDELYDGICTLSDKTADLVDGVNKIADATELVKDGMASLDDGAGQLADGINELLAGLNTLSANNADLNGGAKQVFETLLGTATEQINAAGISVPALTIDNYAAVLNNVLESLDADAVSKQAESKVRAAVEANRPLIEQKVTLVVKEQVEAQVKAAVNEQVTAGVNAAVREQVAAQVIPAACGMSKADYDKAVAAGMVPAEKQDAVNAAIDAQMKTDNVKALTEANITAKMYSEEIRGLIAANLDEQMKSDKVQGLINQNVEEQIDKLVAENMNSPEVQTQLAAAGEGYKSIASLKASLDSFNKFYVGIKTYTAGVASAADGAVKLADGAAALKDGADQLKEGTEELNDGAQTLNSNMPALTDGVEQLKDGAKELSDGLKEFNEKGVAKIVDLINGDVDSVIDRLKATTEVSKNYKNFSGISDDMGGEVKFIYRTDEIKAD